MSLGPGARLGPYAVVAAVGAGGMGEVYRARDAKLNRDVAIKVLPALFAGDPERLARFTREAQTLAALNHSNIAQIYGVVDLPPALVMELVEGEDLSAIIARGPMPLSEALALARQIADALEAAHEQGIVHRDLKPANVKVKPDGTVKVLDFGLAKAMDPVSGPIQSAMNSPTFTAQHTQMGVILGTAAYMAPEQARGKTVDKRADIWAFGVVLFEMLTGRQTFGGDTISEVMAAVMKDDPDWSRLPPGLSPQVLRVLRRCLVKDPKQRLRDIGDARLLLDDVEPPVPSVVDARPAQRRGFGGLTVAAVSGVAIAATAAAMLLATPHGPASTGVTRLSIALPDGDEVADTNIQPLAISPDGTRVVYAGLHAGVQHLFMRNLAESSPVALPGTEGARQICFSPDGQWIAFAMDGLLKKAAVGSAATETVTANVLDPRGLTWGPDGMMYFAPTNVSGIWKVPASGGAATELTRLDHGHGEISHRWPHALPDGKTLFYAVWTGPGSDERTLVALDLTSGERKVIAAAGADTPQYLPGGFVVYGRLDSLFAMPWRPPQPRPVVAPFSLPEMPRTENEGAADFVLSDTGTLAYLAGGSARYLQRVVWVDRATGTVDPLSLPERDYETVHLSPDGQRAIVQVREGSMGLSIYDFARQTLMPLHAAGSSQAGVWTPDSQRIIYRGTRNGLRNLYWRAADGSGNEDRLTDTADAVQTPTDVTPDGRMVVYTEANGPRRSTDIWIMALQGDRTPRLLAEHANDGQVSPDGRWLAYQTGPSGSRGQVLIKPLSGAGPTVQVSRDGGGEPLWSHDGRELFYTIASRTMVVPIGTGATLSAGAPRVLYEGRYRPGPNTRTGYSVSADGKRFLRVQQAQPDPPVTRIDIVLNWASQLHAGGK